MKKAFTLAEVLIVMTVLGVLSAVMVTTLKPKQYRDQAFTTLKQKAYTTVDEATQSVLTDCTTSMNLGEIHDGCDRSATTHAFGTTEADLYKVFLRGTNAAVNEGATGCSTKSGYSNLKLRNGICLYFKSTEVFVDVNGSEGPNDGTTDQFTISIDALEGVSSDLPQ